MQQSPLPLKRFQKFHTNGPLHLTTVRRFIAFLLLNNATVVYATKMSPNGVAIVAAGRANTTSPVHFLPKFVGTSLNAFFTSKV
jgi:hypothetical protein